MCNFYLPNLPFLLQNMNDINFIASKIISLLQRESKDLVASMECFMSWRSEIMTIPCPQPDC